MKKEKVIAELTIKGAAEMHPKTRKEVSAWLKRHAADLLKYGPEYAGTFHGRFIQS